MTYGESTKLRANAFSKTGKTFSGWTAYRESDHTWRYALNNSSTQQGWYTDKNDKEHNKENDKVTLPPAEYTKFVYKNGASLATTTSVNNDRVHLYAVWK